MILSCVTRKYCIFGLGEGCYFEPSVRILISIDGVWRELRYHHCLEF